MEDFVIRFDKQMMRDRLWARIERRVRNKFFNSFQYMIDINNCHDIPWKPAQSVKEDMYQRTNDILYHQSLKEIENVVKPSLIEDELSELVEEFNVRIANIVHDIVDSQLKQVGT